MKGSPAWGLAVHPPDGRFRIEHPSGQAEVYLELGPDGRVTGAGMIRTARKLMDGLVFP
jgi:4-oxalomesaconate tautomerase